MTLEGGLDPDRFIRERGVEAYTAAVRGARRQSDYLIERARQMFPGASAEQKVKAMNYLLPHIRRIPEKLVRDQFAGDAAQKLGIDSAVLREELRQAALKRRDHIETRAAALTEVERVLLRALAITEPEHQDARRLAAEAVTRQPALFQGLGAFRGAAGAGWPRGAGPDGRGGGRGSAGAAGRGAAGGDGAAFEAETVQGAIASLEQRQIREASYAICGYRLPRPSGAGILLSWRC